MLLLALEDHMRGGSYAGCDGAHCCGVVGCLFGLVGLLDARDSMRLMMLEDGWD